MKTHTGIGVPLRRTNVDTDQIIPARFLKSVSRDGFGDGLFSAWREDPAFVLNQDAYKQGSILVAGPDFGTGSSREHAVWALQGYGFKAVFSSRFADIFRNNAGRAGLVAGLMDQGDIDKLQDYLEANPGATLTVDVENQTVEGYPFEIDPDTKMRIVEDLDEIALTLKHEAEIAAYEAEHNPTLHWRED
ncbi:MAG: 3-isopropylmalate dehydratase small subunit [Corynebacterium sp.]|nr:3-isopropylmalate dehydratase small subunit [Corynebacterium sp.]